MQFTAIIPARGGSKGIKNKNTRLLFKKPLIYWSIKYAQMSKHIDLIIVSSDDKKILDYSEKIGVDYAILRPKSISKDYSTDLEMFSHIIRQDIALKNKFIVHLRPTNPFRKLRWMKNMIDIIKYYIA